MHYLILYSYYETDSSLRSLRFFIKNGILKRPNVEYLFIINGKKCSAVFPKMNNVSVRYRPNTGHDFGAWSDALRRTDTSSFNQFIFINDSVCGPFVPRYVPGSIGWYEMFASLLSDEVKLCGLSLVHYPWHPHNPGCKPNDKYCPGCYHKDGIVQSMIFCTDSRGLAVLRRTVLAPNINYEAEYKKSRRRYIERYEIGMSKAILKSGYSIAAHYICDIKKTKTGDVWKRRGYFGSDVNPFETMFIKSNRFTSPLYDMYYRTFM